MDTVDGQAVVRYMMAEGAPKKAAPAGAGDGCYKPVAGPTAVVAVVGSAHVRGICRQWSDAQKTVDVSELLNS